MPYRIYRNVLRLVNELHVRGYQRVRIAPGMAPSGVHWRCTLTPASNISRQHGVRLIAGGTLSANYSSSQEREYFGWPDAAHATPSRLADLFLARFPEIAAAGRGSDWAYAGWYLEMLHLTYPDSLPIAYADWDLPTGYLPTTGARSDIQIPLPPPGEG